MSREFFTLQTFTLQYRFPITTRLKLNNFVFIIITLRCLVRATKLRLPGSSIKSNKVGCGGVSAIQK